MTRCYSYIYNVLKQSEGSQYYDGRVKDSYLRLSTLVNKANNFSPCEIGSTSEGGEKAYLYSLQQLPVRLFHPRRDGIYSDVH